MALRGETIENPVTGERITFVQFFEQLWGGGLTRFGIPELRLATELAGHGYLQEVSLPWVPMAVQRAMQRAVAALGRLLGSAQRAKEGRWRGATR